MNRSQGNGNKVLRYRTIIGIVIISLSILLTINYFILTYKSTFLVDPFFWAFISMFALIGSSITLCCKYMKKYPFLNMVFVGIFAMGRLILVLPSLPQPRFEIYNMNWIVGGFIFMIGLIFFVPLLQIHPFQQQQQKHLIINLKGVRSHVRGINSKLMMLI